MDSIGTLILKAAASAIAAAQETEEADGHRQQAHRAVEPTASAFDTLVSATKRTVYFLVVTGTLLVLSLLSYGMIYSLSMPRVDVRQPVHFDYNFNPERHMSGAYAEHFTRSSNPNLSSERASLNQANDVLASECVEDEKKDGDDKPYIGAQLQGSKRYRVRVPPTAVVDLGLKHTQWHAYTGEVLPGHLLNPSKHVLRPRKRYYVDCSLVLPETDLNKKLGIFMLEIDLLTSDGTLIASSGRSAMLPHESSIISVTRKIVLLGPILIGAVPEARTVLLECFDSFVESSDKPLASLVVRLIVPNNHLVEPTGSPYHSSIQVYSGEIRIGKELNAVQRVMKERFFLCGFLGVLVIMFTYGVWFMIIRAWFWKQMEKRKEADRRDQAEHGYRGTWQQNESNGRWTDDDGDMSDPDWFGSEGSAFGARYSSAEEFDRAEHEWQNTREGNTEADGTDYNQDDSDEWDEVSSIQCHFGDESTTNGPDADVATKGGYQSDEHPSLAEESKDAEDKYDAIKVVHANGKLGDGEGNSRSLFETDGAQNQIDSVMPETLSNTCPLKQGSANHGESRKSLLEDTAGAHHGQSGIPTIPSPVGKEHSTENQECPKAELIELLKNVSLDYGGVATKVEDDRERAAENGERGVKEERSEGSSRQLFRVTQFFGGLFFRVTQFLAGLFGWRKPAPTQDTMSTDNPRPVPMESICTEHDQTSEGMKPEIMQSQTRKDCSIEATSPHAQEQMGARSLRQDQQNLRQPTCPPSAFQETPLYGQDVKAANRTTTKKKGNIRPSAERTKTKSMNKSDSRRHAEKAQARPKRRVSRKQKEEKILAEKVMKGAYDAYEIFTDLDEPDPVLYG